MPHLISRPVPWVAAVTLASIWILLAASAWAAPPPGTGVPADALGRPYYDCLREHAFAHAGTPEAALADARTACAGTAGRVKSRVLDGLRSQMEEMDFFERTDAAQRVNQNHQRGIDAIDRTVLQELQAHRAGKEA